MKQMKSKKERGITLIALVVTIIVLIVLAGISINLIFLENGVVKKAKYAKQSYENGANQEQKDLEEIYGQLLVATDGTISNISLETLQELINKTVDAKIDSGIANPVGTVISYITGENAPAGYLKCDGTVYNISEYKALADAIKDGFGSYNYYGGDGTTTFAVPDLRGEFLRGTGTNSHQNNGDGSNVGTHQDATILPQIEKNSDKGIDYFAGSCKNEDSITSRASTGYAINGTQWSTTSHTSNITSRPTNTSVLYCIKY